MNVDGFDTVLMEHLHEWMSHVSANKNFNSVYLDIVITFSMLDEIILLWY